MDLLKGRILKMWINVNNWGVIFNKEDNNNKMNYSREPIKKELLLEKWMMFGGTKSYKITNKIIKRTKINLIKLSQCHHKLTLLTLASSKQYILTKTTVHYN